MTEETKNTPAEKKISPLTVILWIVVAVLLFLLWNKKEKENAVRPERAQTASVPVVDVAPLTAQKTTIDKNYIGYVTPVRSVSVRPFISGFVENIRVENGQTVQAGELMMTLEQSQYRAQTDEARAALSGARATLENAENYLARVQNAGNQAVSQSEHDKAAAAFLTAKASVARAEAALNAAQVLYGYTIIRAPISGRIGTVRPSKGAYVSPSASSLLEIVQMSPVYVVFSLPDKEFSALAAENGVSELLKGRSISLRLSDGKSYPLTGGFAYADNSADKATGSVAVYALFDNPQSVLVPNSYVDVIVSTTYDDGVLIDQDSVDLTPEGKKIRVANSRFIRTEPVEEIAAVGTKYLVKNTFEQGDYLVKSISGKIIENHPFKLNIISENKE